MKWKTPNGFVEVKSLSEGDAFIFLDEIYLKTQSCKVDGFTRDCVNLQTGKLCSFGEMTNVIPCPNACIHND